MTSLFWFALQCGEEIAWGFLKVFLPVLAIGFATAALVGCADPNPQAVSAHSGDGRLSQVQP